MNGRRARRCADVKFTGGNVGSGGVLTTYARICENGSGVVIENTRTTRANCAAKGGVEWGQPGTEEAEPLNVECEAEENKGKAEGSKSINNVVVKFAGCSIHGRGVPCENAENGATQEPEIDVNELKGELGYINKAAKEVGVKLEPITKHGEFAQFTCFGIIENHRRRRQLERRRLLYA